MNGGADCHFDFFSVYLYFRDTNILSRDLNNTTTPSQVVSQHCLFNCSKMQKTGYFVYWKECCQPNLQTARGLFISEVWLFVVSNF